MKILSIGITMSNCYHPELKIAFVHVPKCAGTSISRELLNHGFISAEDDKWYDYSFQQLEKQIPNIDEYTIVATVRHPVTWMTSGYKFCNYFNWSFEEHLQNVISPTERPESYYQDWYWHCAILPDKHFPLHTTVFKIENLQSLIDWFQIQLNTTIKISHVNCTSGTLYIGDNELSLIKQFTKEYAERWNYDY
jgi:hypothetical protein